MTRPPSSDDTAASSAAVLTAGQDNALPWAKAVRDATIPSRTLVTNRAILDAVCALRPVRVLDLGCGEGWLSWHLCRKGMDVVGVDAVASLIQLARHAATPTDTSSPAFHVISYESLAAQLHGEVFDCVVCNFSLLDDVGVRAALCAVPGLLRPDGRLLIQTLHPARGNEEAPQAEGWRWESWQGIGEGFRGKAPWYYRTQAGWESLFRDCGLQLLETQAPRHPQTGKPASILFVLEA